MPKKRIVVELYLAVDEDGDSTIASDLDDLDMDSLGKVHRVVRLSVDMPQPEETFVQVTLDDLVDDVKVQEVKIASC